MTVATTNPAQPAPTAQRGPVDWLKSTLVTSHATTRRSSYRVVARWLEPRLSFQRPVFLVAAPRSGSSLLAELIVERYATWSAAREADGAWWELFPYEGENWSDEVTAERLRSACSEQRLRVELITACLFSRSVRSVGCLREAVRRRSRYLEKTIANAFHLEAIHAAFPDAVYVHLIRDARENISSMIEGWRSDKFLKRPIPDATGTTLPYWFGPYPPGWRDQLKRPLHEVAAWSWQRHNLSITEQIDGLGLAGSTITVSNEQLLADPDRVVSAIGRHAGLVELADTDPIDLGNRHSWSTVSAPRPDKWKDLNREEIEAVLPWVSPTMEFLEERLTPLD